MPDYSQPLPSSTTQKMFSQWLSIIERKECASIISLPRFDRHYRIAQFLRENGSRLTGVICTTISFQSLVTELKGEFQDRLGKPGSKRQVYFVTDAEWLLTAANHLVPALDEYVMESERKTTFIFFFEKNLLSAAYRSLVATGPILLQNVLFQGLYSRDESAHFIKHLEQLYPFNLSESDRKEILDQCGGYIWLTTEAVRHVHATGHLDLAAPAMQFRLSAVWEGFAAAEKSVLSTVVTKQRLPLADQEAFNYLVRQGLIQKRKLDIRLTVPLLTQHISLVTEQTRQLAAGQGNIFVGSVAVTHFFPQRERRVLEYLLEHPQELISRDTLGHLLWGEKWHEEYSDWALTQAIKRLRTRLIKLGLSREMIRTVKGKGFIYDPG